VFVSLDSGEAEAKLKEHASTTQKEHTKLTKEKAAINKTLDQLKVCLRRPLVGVNLDHQTLAG
jgi:hypothetical protein